MFDHSRYLNEDHTKRKVDQERLILLPGRAHLHMPDQHHHHQHHYVHLDDDNDHNNDDNHDKIAFFVNKNSAFSSLKNVFGVRKKPFFCCVDIFK